MYRKGIHLLSHRWVDVFLSRIFQAEFQKDSWMKVPISLLRQGVLLTPGALQTTLGSVWKLQAPPTVSPIFHTLRAPPSELTPCAFCYRDHGWWGQIRVHCLPQRPSGRNPQPCAPRSLAAWTTITADFRGSEAESGDFARPSHQAPDPLNPNSAAIEPPKGEGGL
jgi:hypothetical protein